MTKTEMIEHYGQEWYDKRLAKKRAHYAENREEMRHKAKAKYVENREEIIAKSCAYQREHRKERNAYNRQWKRNKGCYAYLAPQYDWSQVEGFDGWKEHTVVHHRYEDLGYSEKRLRAMDHYYNCEPWELICMSAEEHDKKPKYGNRKNVNPRARALAQPTSDEGNGH